MDGLWAYRKRRFAGDDRLFDGPRGTGNRPPVFRREHVHHNVIARRPSRGYDPRAVLDHIPPAARHRWFGSMKSSQALAQSVFANLAVVGRLQRLAGLKTPEGGPLFLDRDSTCPRIRMEVLVARELLGEPRQTSIDVLLESGIRVAVECKLSEPDVGTCSRPRLRSGDPAFAAQHCDGGYRRQRGRSQRCSLSEIGVSYWRHIPDLLTWEADVDRVPCPLEPTYQLVRNLLAIALDDGRVNPSAGHVVLLYDERNPAFFEGGAATTAWRAVRDALQEPRLLQRCTWQELVRCLAGDADLAWLVDELDDKYGFGATGGAGRDR